MAETGLARSRLRVLKALLSLAAAKQADFSDAAQDAYIAVLSDLPPETVAATCFELAKRPRGEFEPLMPEAATIRAHALAKVRHDAVVADSARLLAPPIGLQPSDPPAIDQFRERVAQRLRELQEATDHGKEDDDTTR